MSTFESLLTQFAGQAGLSKEKICRDGTANLVFDEKTGVEISDDAANGEICLASRLFQVDNEDDMGPMALLVAQANFEKDRLYGAHLAMSEKGLIVLIRNVPAHTLDNAGFNRLLKEFVDAATQWSDYIASLAGMLKNRHGTGHLADEGHGTALKV